MPTMLLMRAKQWKCIFVRNKFFFKYSLINVFYNFIVIHYPKNMQKYLYFNVVKNKNYVLFQ